MTDRHTVNTITSDALDALYEQLEAAENSEAQQQLATAREAFASATTRAARAEADLAALRAVARGYCPHCGRGDATVEDWEQQKQRADQAEAAVARVQALADECEESGHSSGHPLTTTHIRDALDPAAGPTATQATDADNGPTVAEAAANDRRWPLEKAGE